MNRSRAFSAPRTPHPGETSTDTVGSPEPLPLQPVGPSASKAVNCVAHCTRCGGHFSGDSAFDKHRQGSHQDCTRECVEPMDATDPKGRRVFLPKTESGSCGLADPDVPRVGVTVWSLRAAVEGAERFAA